MKCNKGNKRIVWLYTLCSIIWAFLAIMDIVHGDEWHDVVFHVALALAWGIMAQRLYKEEKIC